MYNHAHKKHFFFAVNLILIIAYHDTTFSMANLPKPSVQREVQEYFSITDHPEEAHMIFSPNSKYLLTSSPKIEKWPLYERPLVADEKNTGTYLWDIESKKRILTIDNHPHAVVHLVFSPKSQWLLLASNITKKSSQTSLINLKTMHIQPITSEDKAGIQKAKFSDNERFLALQSAVPADNNIWINNLVVLDLEDPEQKLPPLTTPNFIHSFNFSSSGRFFAARSTKKTLIRDIVAKNCYLEFKNDVCPDYPCLFTPDDNFIIFGNNKHYHIINTKTRETWSIPYTGDSSHRYTLSPSGTLLVIDEYRNMRVWDLAKKEEIFNDSNKYIDHFSFNPSEELLVLQINDFHTKIINLKKNNETVFSQKYAKLPRCVNPFLDAETIIISYMEENRYPCKDRYLFTLRNIKNGKELLQFPYSSIDTVDHINNRNKIAVLTSHHDYAFANEFMAFPTRTEYTLLDLKNAQEITLTNHEMNKISELKFSPDDTTLASICKAKGITLWRFENNNTQEARKHSCS